MPGREWKRALDWWLQNRLTASAPVLKRRLGTLAALEAVIATDQRPRYRELAARYPLTRWPEVCTGREAQLNLYVLDLLDRYAAPPPTGQRLLDIGAGGWGYLPALASFAGEVWDGIELDAHRRDWTLATRRGYAEGMRRIAPGCRYLSGSLLELRDEYAGISWFLPFVRAGAFAASRLPRRYFAPRALLNHGWRLLTAGGWLLVVNQGEDEATAQRSLFAECSIAARSLGELVSVFSPFRERRFGWMASKPYSPGHSAMRGPAHGVQSAGDAP